MNNKYKILNTINDPNDLKKLDLDSLNALSKEVADYIHNVISEIGGHYSSPLGVVDLTIALHYVYNSPIDKLIWDVGHQAYSHKILTGRREEFSKIRQLNEISGFLKRSESPHDIFGAGHSSTSISAALGFAHVRDLKKTDENIVAIMGDGAMTNGMAFEALNNLGYHKTQLSVILNDNSFSISESVGSLSRYLTRIMTNPTYNQIRNSIWDISGKIPTLSSQIRKILKKTEEGMKASLTPGGLFEELGIRYIGPIDGHDIKNMIKVFKSISTIKSPLLVHVYTNKNKYINQADDDAIKYYSLSPKSSSKSTFSFSKAFDSSILKMAKQFDFTCITAAMKVGTGLSSFADKYPDNYIDVGIAEEHAVTYGAGLSAAGRLPIIAIYSTFMQRAYDQIIHDISLQDLPAILCMDRSGLVGNDGPTHHGVFDISFMRTIPNAIVTAPKDGNELLDLLYTAITSNKLFSIRYGKISTQFNDNIKPRKLSIGSWEIVNSGNDIAILAVGSMVDIGIKVIEYFSTKNNLNFTLINCRFVKPIDNIMLEDIVAKHKNILTLEEGVKIGGFGSSILEYISCNKLNSNVDVIGIDDTFIEQGTRDELLEITGLSVKSICKRIERYINE